MIICNKKKKKKQKRKKKYNYNCALCSHEANLLNDVPCDFGQLYCSLSDSVLGKCSRRVPGRTTHLLAE